MSAAAPAAPHTRKLAVTATAEPDGRLKYKLKATNDSGVGWHDVRMEFRLPAGVRGVEASAHPAVEHARLVWQYPSVPYQDAAAAVVKLQMDPQAASAWLTRPVEYTVTYHTAEPAPPRLRLALVAPPTVQLGKPFALDVRVTNAGDGDTPGGRVFVDELTENGDVLACEAELPAVPSGVVRAVQTHPTPTRAGQAEWRVTVVPTGGEPVVHVVGVRVVAPQAEVRLVAAEAWGTGRAAELAVEVENVGEVTFPTASVLLKLPDGLLDDVRSDSGRVGDGVSWPVDSLAPGQLWRGVVRGRCGGPGGGTVTAELAANGTVFASAESRVSVGFAAPADPPYVKPSGPHVLLAAGPHRFAVPYTRVVRLKSVQVRPLPGSPEWVVGVAVVDGVRQPVFDFLAWVGVIDATTTEDLLLSTAAGIPVGVLRVTVLGEFNAGSGVAPVSGIRRVTGRPDLPRRVWHAATGVATGPDAQMVLLVEPEKLFA